MLLALRGAHSAARCISCVCAIVRAASVPARPGPSQISSAALAVRRAYAGGANLRPPKRSASSSSSSNVPLDVAILKPELDSTRWDVFAEVLNRVPLPDGYLARFAAFEQSVGGFKKKHLLLQALTHASYIKCNQQVLNVLGKDKAAVQRVCNEGLEYLGDSILDFFISSYLFMSRTRADEGQLTRAWSLHARNDTLALVARELNLQAVILAVIQDEKGQAAALADCMEALVAAIYLDRGVEKCAAFFRERVLPAIERAIVERQRAGASRPARSSPGELEDANPRGELQEIVQGIYRRTPDYKCWPQGGPDSGPPYIAVVSIAGIELGRAEGSSAGEAMRLAAAAGVAKIRAGEIRLPREPGADPGS